MNVGLYQAASALNANSRWQEIIAENLSSSSTPGHRQQEVSFSAVEAGLMAAQGPAGKAQHYVQPRMSVAASFQPGELQATGRPTDIGIEGPGFIELQLPNGTTAFTRGGQFHLSAQGHLVNDQGYAVLSDTGPIQADPKNSKPLSISLTGEISQGGNSIGRLNFKDFANPQLLTPITGGLFQADDPALISRAPSTSSVMQGWLENSNTSAVLEMSKLMISMRSFEANQRIVQLQDERMGKTITELAGS